MTLILSLTQTKTKARLQTINASGIDFINQFMGEHCLGDGWRLQYPLSKEFTFYSPVHKSYSRIDYFLFSNSLLPFVTNSKIHPIIISDHAPITFTLNLEKHKTNTRWRLNTSLLKDPQFDALIRREWAAFLEMNDSPGSSTQTLWETGKAVLRGIIISYSSHTKKKESQLQIDLEQKIKQLETLHANNPVEETETELRKTKVQLNDIISKKNVISNPKTPPRTLLPQ